MQALLYEICLWVKSELQKEAKRFQSPKKVGIASNLCKRTPSSLKSLGPITLAYGAVLHS